MAEKQAVLVEIIHGTQVATGGCSCCSGGCDAADSCGPTIDHKEMTNHLADILKGSFGNQVEVKYVDADKEGLDNYPIMQKVLQMGYPYPITLINGQPRYAGALMFPEIKTSVEEELAKGSN